MVVAIFELLGAIAKIVELKVERKYIDELTSLEREYREELSKPFEKRNNAAIDDVEFRLRQLARNITASIRR